MLDTKRIRDLRGIGELSRILPIKIEAVPEVVRHYGLWHDETGWWWWQDHLFITEHRAIALAQEDAVNRIRSGDWRVRCIEEWADDQ